MNIFYVYLYFEPGQQKPFYVGKGYGNRCYQHFSRSKILKPLPLYVKLREMLMQNQIPNIVKIIEDVSEEEALKVEEALITEYGRIDIGGTLLNIKRGGGKESKLKFIPTKEENFNLILAKASTLIKGIFDVKYDRLLMTRMVNNDTHLQTLHLKYVHGGMEIEYSLRRLFHEEVKDSEEYLELWESLKDENYPSEIIPDVGRLSTCSGEIKKIIDQFGWRNFLIGLSDYADKQVLIMKKLGLDSRAGEWHSVKEKLKGIRKTVQE